MAVRTIRTGVGTYQRPDGQWTHGVMGDEVDVRDEDLERFDSLNSPVVLAADDPNGEPVEIVGEEMPDAGDSTWTHDRIDEYAREHSISYDGITAKNAEKPTREEKVAHIHANTPEAVLTPADQS